MDCLIYFLTNPNEWALLLVPLGETESQNGNDPEVPMALTAPSIPYTKAPVLAPKPITHDIK